MNIEYPPAMQIAFGEFIPLFMNQIAILSRTRFKALRAGRMSKEGILSIF